MAAVIPRVLPVVCAASLVVAAQSSSIRFELVQPELFSAPGGQPNAWADYDLDGDLDLFVGFRGAANRLYRNDRGVFVDVAASAGLADTVETRAAAWGDFDADGDPDLYVGFANAPTSSPTRRATSTPTARSISRSPTTIRKAAATRCSEMW